MAEIKDCLHCTIRGAVDEWLGEHATDAKGGFNVADVIDGLAEVLAEYVEMPPERNQRRRALRHAHAALDAGIKAVRSGEPQLLKIPTEH